MARLTIADLKSENERLQSEVRDLRSRLESLASTVLSALDIANASVARHIRMMQLEHDEQHAEWD